MDASDRFYRQFAKGDNFCKQVVASEYWNLAELVASLAGKKLSVPPPRPPTPEGGANVLKSSLNNKEGKYFLVRSYEWLCIYS